jgi:riboflavin synthase
MFTGIIEELGSVKSITSTGNRAWLTISAKVVLEDLTVGDSIAVNGACLTATEVSPASFAADVSHETLRVTNLGSLQSGSPVNLERALRVSDRLDGHLVLGHVDDTARILAIEKKGDTFNVLLSIPESIRRYIVKKGSIAIDGISLTINAVDEKRFTCTIIPHTAQKTTIGLKKAGDFVNLEADIIGRYVENFLLSQHEASPQARGIDMTMLREHGWVT